MRQPPKNSARKANKKPVRNTSKTPNQNNKAKSGVGNMTRFSRVFFEERAKTNQKRTQTQANKLTLAPTLRAIKPVKPAVRGKPFGERVFCPAGCETVSVISEPIDGGMKLFIKYPSAENAARAKRGISILRSDIKGKRVLLQALPKKQKQAWRKTAIQLANHSSPSTIVLKFSSMRGGGEARLPPEFASRIFSSYPDFTSRLTQENIVEYWKFFMMNKFNKSKNTPLQLKDVQKRLTDRDLVSKGNTKNFQIYKQPYRILQAYAAQIAKMANMIRMKTTNTVNVATKRNNRLRAERIIPPKIVMLTYTGQVAFYIEDKGGSRAYFPVMNAVNDALEYYRNLKKVTEFLQKVDNFTTKYGPNTNTNEQVFQRNPQMPWHYNQRMFRTKNTPTKNRHWEQAKATTMKIGIDPNPVLLRNSPAFFLALTPAQQAPLVAAVQGGTANERKYVLQITEDRTTAPQANVRGNQLQGLPQNGHRNIRNSVNPSPAANALIRRYVQARGLTPEKARAKIKSFLKQIDVSKVNATRAEIHDQKFKVAMNYHITRRTRQVFTREIGDNSATQSAPYGRLVTGMVARVGNEDDVERILVGKGIDGFSIKEAPNQPARRLTFMQRSDYGNTTKIRKLSTSGAQREEVYTQFLTHLSHSQIAPITVDAVDQRQVTDLQSMLRGTNAFEQGRALCWLKSFVFDPKKQVIFGDQNTKIADRRKNMEEFAARLKLGRCQ
jgi:hypothetical protein